MNINNSYFYAPELLFCYCLGEKDLQPVYKHMHIAHHFKGHSPGKPGLASYPFDCQSSVIFTLNILTANVLHILYLM